MFQFYLVVNAVIRNRQYWVCAVPFDFVNSFAAADSWWVTLELEKALLYLFASSLMCLSWFSLAGSDFLGYLELLVCEGEGRTGGNGIIPAEKLELIWVQFKSMIVQYLLYITTHLLSWKLRRDWCPSYWAGVKNRRWTLNSLRTWKLAWLIFPRLYNLRKYISMHSLQSLPSRSWAVLSPDSTVPKLAIETLSVSQRLAIDILSMSQCTVSTDRFFSLECSARPMMDHLH